MSDEWGLVCAGILIGIAIGVAIAALVTAMIFDRQIGGGR